MALHRHNDILRNRPALHGMGGFLVVPVFVELR